ncbi:hypothetical protein ACLX1H_004861 [Fusarium chlamydosporum]
MNRREQLLSPCATVINHAQRVNEAHNHENEGFLSYELGFIPSNSPITRLPRGFDVWDRLAASLPVLLRDQTLRSEVKSMEVLPADAQSLPEKCLQRASTILSIVSHAYMNSDMTRSVEQLPECLSRPWNEVTKRLGRQRPALNYIDLVVYNWQRKDAADDKFCVENLELLVPTVNNAEERIFYLTQAEILSRTTPLLHAVVDAQVAVQSDDVDTLKTALSQMQDTLNGIGRKTLMKITPVPGRKSYVDPVVWSLSVAPLAMPLGTDVPGPGGIASPLFHLMDNFIGRSSYTGVLGEEAERIRKDYPRHWREVISAAAEVDIAAYVDKKEVVELSQAWEAMKDLYRGSMGLLGLHRRKVFAYLPTAFKLGCSATIAGFKGDVAQAKWLRVHDELEKSRQERYTDGETSQDKATTLSSYKATDKSYPVSVLVEHSNKSLGYWFAAKGRVYDATSFLRIHPGGDKILINSGGRDVTSDLLAVSHLQEPTISSKLEKYVIGNLDIRVFDSMPLCNLYDFSVAMAYKVTDLYTTMGNNMTFLESKLTSVEAPGEMTEQKKGFVSALQRLLREQSVPSIASYAAAIATLCRSLTGPRFKALQNWSAFQYGSATVASIKAG